MGAGVGGGGPAGMCLGTGLPGGGTKEVVVELALGGCERTEPVRRLADLFSAGTGLSENLPERRIPGDALPALDGTEEFLGGIGAEVPSDPTVRC